MPVNDSKTCRARREGKGRQKTLGCIKLMKHVLKHVKGVSGGRRGVGGGLQVGLALKKKSTVIGDRQRLEKRPDALRWPRGGSKVPDVEYGGREGSVKHLCEPNAHEVERWATEAGGGRARRMFACTEGIGKRGFG